MKEFKQFMHYMKENSKPVLLILILYFILEIYLGTINYYYIDDIARRVTGDTNFGAHYARYFSEVSAWLVQGSIRMSDLGLTTYILSGLILTLISTLAIYLMSDRKPITWLTAAASIFIGINPWSLELMSFRFDSPYMLLSILVSFVPFLWYRTNIIAFFVSSIVGVFLMFNSYQASSGIYIFLVILLGLMAYLEHGKIIEWLKFSIIGALGYGTALIAYFVEMMFNPQLAERGGNTTMASLSELPQAIWNNLVLYFSLYREGLHRVWKILVFIAVVAFIVVLIKSSKINKFKASFFTLVASIIASVMSIGIYMATAVPIIDDRPRYVYGLAVLIGLVLIYVASHLTKGFSGKLVGLSVLCLIYYSYSFALSYVSVLDNQKINFEAQSIALSSRLNSYITETNNRVYINQFLENSPAFENAKKNNTMFMKLVPSNTSLYWPNLMWYNEVTHSNVEFIPKDYSNEDMSKYELLENSHNFDIYRKDGEIFVIMK